MDEYQKLLQTDAGMRRFMDTLFGDRCWDYDASEDVWVAPDRDHTGSGRGFVVVKRGGRWFKTIIPESELS